MRIAGIVFAVLVALVVAFLWLTAPSDEQRQKAAEAASAMRHAVLSRDLLKGSVGKAPGDIRAVVFDWELGNGTATLVAFDDGTTSLYLNPGGGIIGAGSREPVRRAAERFRLEAAKVSKSFAPVTAYPVPADGHSTFYIVTDSATLGSGPIRSSELAGDKHPLSELGKLAQHVITQIRKST